MKAKKNVTRRSRNPAPTEAEWWDRNPDFIAEQFEKASREGTIVRGVPPTQSVTIRITSSDLAAARKLAKAKGLPYQTYIKSLLHQALEREKKAS